MDSIEKDDETNDNHSKQDQKESTFRNDLDANDIDECVEEVLDSVGESLSSALKTSTQLLIQRDEKISHS